MAASSVRILIADDHEIVRSGLRTFVEAHPRWMLVGEAVNGKDAVIKALQSKPDVAVLDYSLPIKNGIEATREIRARLPATEVLIFTMYDSDAIIGELLAAGARGFLMKSDTEKYIVPAIDAQAVLHFESVRSHFGCVHKTAGAHQFRADAARAWRSSACCRGLQ